ncbi:MAG: bifunctional alpha/beta hydrolase/OsmC family protein [Gammaproteobacteria bacterium]|nr:bifunctional alpha/beta hydrolase/OsmC family protein [Gammaproteobacteria bacterium]MDH3480421.1 bifunctional alpha/beta hydrolase/OsmC family protein [Gammaproteobacteria bacterium]
MPHKKITFENQRRQALSGILDLPAAAPVAYVLFAHCFTCSKNLTAATNIARSLTDAGIAVLRFDFTGLGQSEGEFSDTNFSSNVDDLLAAVSYLEREHEAPAILVGHSLGGTAVLQAAANVESAVAVVTIGSPSEPAHVARMFRGSADTLRDRGEATVNLGGRPFLMKQQFLDDLGKQNLRSSIGSLRKALLIMHAPLDDVVDIDNASALFMAAKHPKSFVSLDTADHLLSRETDSRYAGRVLASWASRYLPESKGPVTPPAADTAVVAKTSSGGFKTVVRMGDYVIVADEPPAVGGTGLGPTPYDLLSAALATCTSMTLRMYARHKKLKFESATVRVEHDKIHARDCEDCESGAGKIDEFRRTISLEGDLSDAERKRMLEIADRCPVHLTLHGETKVRSALG